VLIVYKNLKNVIARRIERPKGVRFDEAISRLQVGDCFVEHSPLRFECSPRNDILKRRMRMTHLFADIKLLNELAVLGDVLLGEIIEQAPALTDHLQQPTAAVVVFGIFLEVRGEGIDLLGEDGDLYFRAPRIVRRFAELCSELLLCFFCNWHRVNNDSARMNAAATSRYERPGSHVPRMGTGF